MYCKYCGEHNSDDQTYCQKCGNLVKNNSISLKDLNISETKSSFCKKCGTQVLDRYCTNCGTVGYSLNIITGKTKSQETVINLGSLEDIKSKLGETSLGDIKSVSDVKGIIHSKPIFKKSFISAIKTLGIGLLMSLFLFMLISKTKAVEGIFNSIDMAASYSYPELAKLKPNFLNFFNLALQSPINIAAKFKGEFWGEAFSANMKTIFSMKILILLLVPAIGVLISEFKTFKDETSTKENLPKFALSSLIFSILAKILAIITGKNVKVQDPYEYINMGLKIRIHDFWSILSVFLIVFTIYVILSMIFKKDNPFEILNNKHCEDIGYRTKTYLKSMGGFIGIVSIALSLTMIVLFFKLKIKSKAFPVVVISLLPSTFIHTWLMSFGNSITTMVTGQKPMTMNIGKMWKTIGTMKDQMFGSNNAWAYFGYLLIIFIFIGLIYVIFKTLKDIEKEGYFKKLAIIAGVISIINMGLSYFAIIGLKVTTSAGRSGPNLEGIFYDMGLGLLGELAEAGALKQSYPLFTIILLTFLWIFAIGAIIYFVREHHIYSKFVDFVEKHNVKLIVAYAVLILVSSYLLQSKIFNEITYELMDIFPMLDLFF